jgi:acetyltransferase-like isoleucine patch superfamily enzyme
LKNRLCRLVGVKLGKDTEIMQAAWLDHFCPELIYVGDHTLVGAFCKISTHSYEGAGKFRVGLVRIGDDCVLASGVSLAAIRIGDGTRVLPNTTLSPYFARIHRYSLVGGEAPAVSRLPQEDSGEDKKNEKKFD